MQVPVHRCLSCAAPLPTHACAFVCARLPAPPPAPCLPAHAEACACEHRATDYGPRLTGAVCGRAGARVQQALDKALSRVAMLAMGGMGVASVANSCIYDVDGGKRAIMFNRFPNPLTGEGGGIQKHIMTYLMRAAFLYYLHALFLLLLLLYLRLPALPVLPLPS